MAARLLLAPLLTLTSSSFSLNMPATILVTGGTGASPLTRLHRVPVERELRCPRADHDATRAGLVGKAIEWTVEHEAVGSQFGKFADDDQWIYLSSKDGDLRLVPCPPPLGPPRFDASPSPRNRRSGVRVRPNCIIQALRSLRARAGRTGSDPHRARRPLARRTRTFSRSNPHRIC